MPRLSGMGDMWIANWNCICSKILIMNSSGAPPSPNWKPKTHPQWKCNIRFYHDNSSLHIQTEANLWGHASRNQEGPGVLESLPIHCKKRSKARRKQRKEKKKKKMEKVTLMNKIFRGFIENNCKSHESRLILSLAGRLQQTACVQWQFERKTFPNAEIILNIFLTLPVSNVIMGRGNFM